jgi:hypothetical protein
LPEPEQITVTTTGQKLVLEDTQESMAACQRAVLAQGKQWRASVEGWWSDDGSGNYTPDEQHFRCNVLEVGTIGLPQGRNCEAGDIIVAAGGRVNIFKTQAEFDASEFAS